MVDTASALYLKAYDEALADNPLYDVGTKLAEEDWSRYINPKKQMNSVIGSKLLQMGLSSGMQDNPAAAQDYVNKGMAYLESANKPNWKDEIWPNLIQKGGAGLLQGLGESQELPAYKDQYLNILGALGNQEAMDKVNQPGWRPQKSMMDLNAGAGCSGETGYYK